METPESNPAAVGEPDAGSRDKLQEALRGLSDELLGPAAVLQAFAPRLTGAVERGDSSTLVVIADVIERNSLNLEAVLESWQRLKSPSEAGLGRGDESLGELWQMVMHELRTPVAVIQGSATTLKTAVDFMDSSSLAKMSNAIERGAGRLGELVESFSNIDALARGEMDLDSSYVELGGLVSQIVGDLDAITRPHPVSVVAGIAVRGHVDPLRLRQVITNLLSNAAKFSPAAAPIRVEIVRDGDEAKVSVFDGGPGIPPDRFGELFKRFSRLDAGGSGMGLGLFLSRAIARAHGGDLTVTIPREGGSCFVLSLPARP